MQAINNYSCPIGVIKCWFKALLDKLIQTKLETPSVKISLGALGEGTDKPAQLALICEYHHPRQLPVSI